MISCVAIFRRQLRPGVLLFDIRAIKEEISDSVLVGSVTVNIEFNRKIKTFIQGHDVIEPFKRKLVAECEEMAKSIIEVIQSEI